MEQIMFLIYALMDFELMSETTQNILVDMENNLFVHEACKDD